MNDDTAKPGESPVLRKIGEIAASTGMTIRTLHYYEEIGLITPTARTDAGHRLYGPEALEQLYRISFLRQPACRSMACGPRSTARAPTCAR